VDKVLAPRLMVWCRLGGKTKDVGDTMLTDGTSNVINARKANNVVGFLSFLRSEQATWKVRLPSFQRS
jgi:hypothetical protein